MENEKALNSEHPLCSFPSSETPRQQRQLCFYLRRIRQVYGSLTFPLDTTIEFGGGLGQLSHPTAKINITANKVEQTAKSK